MSRGFGIVGTGVIATIHADAIATLPDARLVAVTGRAVGAAAAFAAARGCLAEPDLAALLARRDVEVVSGVGHWYKGGAGLVPVRWVFVHDKSGTHRDEYFYTTDLTLTPPGRASTWSWRSRSTSAWTPLTGSSARRIRPEWR